MLLAALLCGVLCGRTEETVAAIANGAFSGLETVFSFAGAMCFWCGIMNIAKKSGMTGIIERLLSPVVDFLFGEVGERAKSLITMNISANLLGLGNAATPMGVNAMHELDIRCGGKNPSKAMCMLMILNTTSFTLLPTGIISYRTSAGGDAAAVLLPMWITSAVSVAAAVTAVKLFYGGAQDSGGTK